MTGLIIPSKSKSLVRHRYNTSTRQQNPDGKNRCKTPRNTTDDTSSDTLFLMFIRADKALNKKEKCCEKINIPTFFKSVSGPIPYMTVETNTVKMKKSILRKSIFGTAIFLAILVAALGVHIFLVTRPGKPDAGTVAMARIDIGQPIDPSDAQKITAWLYTQRGVEHVLCNPETRIVVFTYRPVVKGGDDIVNDFRKALPYKAKRFLPSPAQLRRGCPVARGPRQFSPTI